MEVFGELFTTGSGFLSLLIAVGMLLIPVGIGVALVTGPLKATQDQEPS
ncbi:hypothetical protein [Isoalcanivorax beigongshangi]|uniref:Photosystem II reaction center X protein n=1 Tax=Isoalcanivorax beigongshangi TaxID=3238810 RepID=A0ABV4AFJ5_9GAMM